MKVESLKESVYEISDKNKRARIIGTENIIKQAMETNAIQQLLNIGSLPGLVDDPVGLPDIHPGYGFPIGSVAAFDADSGIVLPGGVGYDINCGVSLLSTGLSLKVFLEKRKEFMDEVFKRVPVGMARSRFKPSLDDLNEIVETGLKWAYGEGLCDEHDMRVTQDSGSMYAAERQNISESAMNRGMNYLGTLGSGNHFMEIQNARDVYDEDMAQDYLVFRDMVYIMVHTGSRGLGHQVATDYMEEVENICHDENVPDRQLKYVPIKSQTGEMYISAMNGAANYGFVNRQIIINNIRDSLKSVYGKEFVLEDSALVCSISHNIARFERVVSNGRMVNALVHRKGATSAFGPSRATGHFSGKGDPVLIPGSMGTRSFVLTGRDGNENISISSSSHGAGRVLSRKRSRDEISSSEVYRDLLNKNILALSPSEYALAEESPESYKDIDDVIRASEQSKIAKKVASLIPIGVIKG